MADKSSDKTEKQPFVAQADRPEVGLKSDTPLSELRVRDLFAILGQVGGTGKDFWDGKSWQKDDFDGGVIKSKDGKEYSKDNKDGKDGKEGKDGKDIKDHRKEKHEIKELKLEKLESDGVFEPNLPGPGPDPRLEQVIQALSGLSARVAHLANQVEELRKARKD
jgi:hypothetical protein